MVAPSQVYRWGAQIVAALALIHSRGRAHASIKPENICIGYEPFSNVSSIASNYLLPSTPSLSASSSAISDQTCTTPNKKLSFPMTSSSPSLSSSSSSGSSSSSSAETHLPALPSLSTSQQQPAATSLEESPSSDATKAHSPYVWSRAYLVDLGGTEEYEYYKTVKWYHSSRTFLYLSPYVSNYQPYYPRDDLMGLSYVLLHMIRGNLPWGNDDAAKWKRKPAAEIYLDHRGKTLSTLLRYVDMVAGAKDEPHMSFYRKLQEELLDNYSACVDD